MSQVKLERGQRVMGFRYNNSGSNCFFVGTIRGSYDLFGHLDMFENSIIIIDPEFSSSPSSFDMNIDIYTEFDQKICDDAIEIQKKADEFNKRQRFEELRIVRLLMKQAITQTYEEYHKDGM